MAKPTIEPTKHPFLHHLPIQLRFTDIDMLGHLNNTYYLQFMDLAKVDYLTKARGQSINWQEIDLVVANINVNFLAQTRYGEPIEVLTQVESVGTKSMQLQQAVVRTDTGELKCAASVVMVAVDLATQKTIPISQEWIDAFSKMEKRPVK
jgi:acyl-CoA thioester hydrolase